MVKKILMNFDPEGRVKIEAQGYEGGTCMDATKPFEDMYGGEVSPREMRGECAPGTDSGEFAT